MKTRFLTVASAVMCCALTASAQTRYPVQDNVTLQQSAPKLTETNALRAQPVTNAVLDLHRQLASFTNLQGRVYNGQLLTADWDGIVYLMPDGTSRNKVWYTNFSPATLERLGIPTNRIEIAAKRAEARKHADRRYQAALEQRREEMAQDAALQGAAMRKQAKKDSVIKAGVDRASAVDAQTELVRQLQQKRDAAWDYYVDTPSDVWNSQNGVVTDSDTLRRQRARQADRDLQDAREKLSQMQYGK